ncbi:DUF5984 family protein [Actinoplanes sp. NPDC051494]|uniref:DUF5984 family protein n=1 Tax=Actinoplanes sp. NPDC051494 TaxID=3363907 RepID=UPI0037A9C454
MFRVEFELLPLAEVPAWGGDHPRLHWFGLTSGWYWIRAQDGEFLRYSDEAVRTWELERPYPDYYVARLWEDLVVLRWALQEPVPEDLIPFVDGTFSPREFPEADDIGEDVDAAFEVQSDYALDLGYLTDAPHLSCWRHAGNGSDMVTLSQQAAPRQQGTFAVTERLDVTVPTAELFAALDDFDRRFLAAMQDRVAELERSGPPPGVELDLQQLRAEHTQRSHWLERRLAVRRDVDWTKVRAGAAELSSWPPACPPVAAAADSRPTINGR